MGRGRGGEGMGRGRGREGEGGRVLDPVIVCQILVLLSEIQTEESVRGIFPTC